METISDGTRAVLNLSDDRLQRGSQMEDVDRQQVVNSLLLLWRDCVRWQAVEWLCWMAGCGGDMWGGRVIL